MTSNARFSAIIPRLVLSIATAVYTGAVGIPAYGVPGLWTNPDCNGIHRLNGRIEVQSLLTRRTDLYDLVKAYAY